MLELAIFDFVASNNARYWYGPLQQPEWWLVFAAFLTLGFLCWQTWETRRSAETSKTSAAAALLNAQALINAERAWILAELGWYENLSGRILLGDFREGNGPIFSSTTANLKLTCRNEGKSPAWIDKIYGRMDLVSTRDDIKEYGREDCGNFGSMEPIGAAGETSRGLSLVGDGRLEEGAFLSISVIIDYHDVFGQMRETTLGYSLSLVGNLNRQNAAPTRNRNT